MRLLIFGRTGQVARELTRNLSLENEALFLDREAADLQDPDICASAIDDFDCDAVINAAAYTAVDQAEYEESLAFTINASAPRAMALAARAKDIPFLHVSTDYVFDGSGEAPFRPDSPVAPMSAYGRTKLAGEAGIAKAGGHWAILRTSWVFSGHGGNFVKTMLRLGAEREKLDVVSDQIGAPTPAADIARALLIMAQAMSKGANGGIHHFAGIPNVSWADFARAIMTEAGLDCEINNISTSEYPTPARRPANSRLDCSSLSASFGIERPDWRSGLRTVIKELGQK